MGNRYVPHGITFTTVDGNESKHTWKDWRLVPTSRPVIAPPDVKENYIDISGADGYIDMTESLTGDVKYKNRTGSIEFLVENKESWELVYSNILDYLHGQKKKMILDDDQGYYYIGRFSINEWKSEKFKSKIVINYNTDPYKYEQKSSLEDWEWDTFNFEIGYIRDYRDIEIVGKRNVAIDGTRKTIVPTIIATIPEGETLTVYSSINYQVVTLANGKNKNPYLKIPMEGVRYTFSGVGKISIDYRGARL